MRFVSQLLDKKGHDVWSVTPSTTVFDALRLMAEKKVGAVLVLEEDRLVGVFSERDYARKVILQGRSSEDTEIKVVMTSKVVCVTLDRSTEECMTLMTEKRVRHLPVMDGDNLVGVISIGDVVKSMISEREQVIEQLEGYISGAF
jgi:CBS domain-containing protein